MGRDALRRLVLAEAKDRIRGAARLERAGLLEVFAFEEQVGAGQVVEKTRVRWM
jgi:hypothetical protein